MTAAAVLPLSALIAVAVSGPGSPALLTAIAMRPKAKIVATPAFAFSHRSNLHELLPGRARFAALVNPVNPFINDPFVRDVQAAAATIGREIEVVMARTNSDIDAAFATFANKRVDAFLISPEALFVSRRAQLLTLAARHALPSIYHRREFAEAGGLMS